MKKQSIKINRQTAITDKSVLSLRQYFSEIGKKEYSSITKDQEYALFEEYNRTKSVAIKERIIKSNMKFVISVAKSFIIHDIKFYREKACLEDLINEGNIGLIKAFETFDYKKGFRFLTYATPHIRQNISTYLNETIADIQLPANQFRLDTQLKIVISKLKDEGITEPTIEDIVETYNEIKEPQQIKLTVNLLAQINDQRKSFISSEVNITSALNGEDMLLSDTFKADGSFDTDLGLHKESINIAFSEILKETLSEREITILEYTYGMNGKEERSLYQISEILGLTRERIGQILEQALKKLQLKKEKFNEAIS